MSPTLDNLKYKNAKCAICGGKYVAGEPCPSRDSVAGAPHILNRQSGEDPVDRKAGSIADSNGPQIIKLSELTKDIFAKKLADRVGVDPEQLKMGIEVEREHAGTLGTSDMKVLAKVAIDHLKEKPDYYTALKKMEKGTSNIKNDTQAEDIDIAQGRTQTCKQCGNITHKTGGYCSSTCRRDAEEDDSPVTEKRNEVSTTAGVAGFMTPKAFSSKKWKRKNSILDKRNKK